MPFGIIAAEVAEPGSPFWEVAANDMMDVAMYAPLRLTQTIFGEPRPLIAKSLVRDIGVIDYEYGRYEPRDSKSFVRLCQDCLGNPHWVGLAVPCDTSDDTARAIITQFNDLMPTIELNIMDKKPIGRLLKAQGIPTEWAYFLGFYPRDPVTFLISQTLDWPDKLARQATTSKTYVLLERWPKDKRTDGESLRVRN